MSDFNIEVEAILRATLGNRVKYDFACQLDDDIKIPAGLAMIFMELIRNVKKHEISDHTTTLKLNIELEKNDEFLSFVVKSSPHNESLCRRDLEKLNLLSTSNSTLTGNKLGGKLIKHLVEEIMGGKIKWYCQSLSTENHMEVTVFCEIPC